MNLNRSATKLNPRLSCRAAGLALLAACAAGLTARAANWPGWRGPNGDGTTTTVKNLPETWSPTQNIKWKIATPAWSGSSPTIWGDKIFLNSPSKEEASAPAPATDAPSARKKKRPAPSRVRGPAGQEILLLCLNRATGKELWRQTYDRGDDIKMKHNMSSISTATSTPATRCAASRPWSTSRLRAPRCVLEGARPQGRQAV